MSECEEGDDGYKERTRCFEERQEKVHSGESEGEEEKGERSSKDQQRRP